MKKNKSLKLVEILKDNLANINLPINEMQSLCQTNGITLKVYERLPDIFKVWVFFLFYSRADQLTVLSLLFQEEHYEWLEEMQDYYDLESSDFTDSDDSDDDFEMTSDDDEVLFYPAFLSQLFNHSNSRESMWDMDWMSTCDTS